MVKIVNMKSEETIIELFKEKFDIQLVKIPETDAKTPDYMYKPDSDLIFVAELKDIIRGLVSEKTGWKKDNGWWRKKENAVKKVADKIHEAYKQLKKYNSPKVLIILNYDPSVDFNDLNETYDGFLDYGSPGSIQIRNTASAKIANGRIKDEKDKIDLYIWIDGRDNNKFSFRTTSDAGKSIKQIHFK